MSGQQPPTIREALNDLYGAILKAYEGRRMLHLCDGILVWRAKAGNRGRPKAAGVIFASADAVSLDRVAHPSANSIRKIFVTKIAHEREYGEGDLKNIDIVGESDAFEDLKFQNPSITALSG